MKTIQINPEFSDGFEIVFDSYLCTLYELDKGLRIQSIDFRITEVDDLVNGLLDYKRKWKNEYGR